MSGVKIKVCDDSPISSQSLVYFDTRLDNTYWIRVYVQEKYKSVIHIDDLEFSKTL
jgi:hypothetical protein